MDIDDCQRLALYNRWATRRIAPAISTLTDEEFSRELGGSFPSIRATCAHLVAVAELWHSRLNGVSPKAFRDVDAFPADAASVVEQWFRADEAVTDFAKACSDPEKRLEVVNIRGDHYVHSIADMIQHFVNHQSYHRGQLTALLRQLGKQPASQDLIAYLRETYT